MTSYPPKGMELSCLKNRTVATKSWPTYKCRLLKKNSRTLREAIQYTRELNLGELSQLSQDSGSDFPSSIRSTSTPKTLPAKRASGARTAGAMGPGPMGVSPMTNPLSPTSAKVHFSLPNLEPTFYFQNIFPNSKFALPKIVQIFHRNFPLDF